MQMPTRYPNRFPLLSIVLSIVLAAQSIGAAPSAVAAPLQSGWIRQNAVVMTIAFFDPPWEPHFGANFYSGATPYDPNYTGGNGNADTLPYDGGIKHWNWWGPAPSSWLLIPKSFYFGDMPQRGNPTKYNAMCRR